MKLALSTGVCAAGLSVLLVAQPAKVSIAITPKPGQTVHYVTTQDLDIDVTPEAVAGTTPAFALPPMKVASKTTLAFTMVTNAASPEGRITSQVTYEQAKGEISLNGTPFSTGAALGDLVDKTFTIGFDAEGNVIETTAPDASEATLASMKALFAQMYKFYPAVSLSVGEAVNLPLSLKLPLPIPGGMPVSVDGLMTVKIASLDQEGADRIATGEQSYDGALAHPAASGAAAPGAAGVDMTMRGGGKLQINVDQHLVKSSHVEMTIDGAVPSPAGGAGAPKLKIHGIMKLGVTGR